MPYIKGKRAILEAIKTKAPIETIFVAHEAQHNHEVRTMMELAYEKHLPLEIIPRADLDRRLKETHHQGLAAYITQVDHGDLEDIINAPDKYPFIVALDHLQDPYNFGAILRSCEQFGVSAVIYPKDRNTKITPGVIKVSSGAVSHLNLINVTNLAQTLTSLKRAGYWIYGADSHSGRDISRQTPHFPLVLVMGNEEKGLSRLISKQCDERLIIPTVGKIDSLNVSVAAGICCYQLSLSLRTTQRDSM